MRNYLILAATLVLCGCSSLSTPEQIGAVTAGVTAGGTFLAEAFGVIQPFLKPEQSAALAEKLAGAQNWMQGLVQVVGAVGQQVSTLAQEAEAARQAAEAAKEGGITTEQATVGGGVILAASRGLSAWQRANRRVKQVERA